MKFINEFLKSGELFLLIRFAVSSILLGIQTHTLLVKFEDLFQLELLLLRQW